MIFRAQGPLAGLRGPSSSSSSSFSEQYDYGGLEDHLKRQEETSALRNSKFASLYGGDVASSMAAGSRIRELVDSLRVHTPGATERRPVQIVSPLVKTTNVRSDASGDTKSGELVFGEGPKFDAPPVNGGGGGGGQKPPEKDPLIDVNGPTIKAGGATERLADEGTRRLLPDGKPKKPKKRDSNPLPDQGEMLA